MKRASLVLLWLMLGVIAVFTTAINEPLCNAPSILQQPAGVACREGETASFSVSVAGSGPMVYWWSRNAHLLHDGGNISGARTATLTVSNITAGDAGFYRLLAGNGCGEMLSSKAFLTVLVPPVVEITNPIQNAVIIADTTNITLGATATPGAGTIVQVEFFQESNSLGVVANAPYNLVWNNVPPGPYSFTAVAENSYGLSATSAVVHLGVSTVFPTDPVALWFKAESLAELENGAPVGTWPDSSGKTNHATQRTLDNQPRFIDNAVNGRPVVRFDGTNDHLNLPFGSLRGLAEGEVFVIMRAATDNSGIEHGWWRLGNGEGAGGYPRADGTIRENFGTDGTYNIGNPTQPLAEFHLYNVSAAIGDWRARINGVLQYLDRNNAVYFWPDAPRLGATYYYFAGDIAELLMFERVLSSEERKAVSGYLNAKYAIAPPPLAPASLEASPVSASQVSLTWSFRPTNATAWFEIERRDGPDGMYERIASIRDATSYLDTQLAAGTQYYYRLKADNFAGDSGYSNETNATTLGEGPDLPLGDLKLWLKADTGVVRQSTDNSVRVWFDQSGNCNDASQVIAGAQPVWTGHVLNDRPVVRFSDTNGQFFTLPNPTYGITQAEGFVVLRVKEDMPDGRRQLWRMGQSSSGAIAYPDAGGNIVEDFASMTVRSAGNPGQPLDQCHLYNVAGRNGFWAVWINGVPQCTTTNNVYGNTSATTTLGYGGGGCFDGDIAEVLIFNRVLSSAERERVGGYLNSKYAFVPAAPEPPANLVAAPTSPTQINLAWSNAAVGAGIQVERSAGGNGYYAVVTALAAGTTNYSDGGLPAGQTYFYRLRAFNLAGFSSYSNEANAPANSDPSVALTAPTNAAAFTRPVDITLAATAADVDGIVSRVEFFHEDTTKIGEDNSPPYSVVWSNPPVGTRSLTAKATDNLGGTTTSAPVIIIVNNRNPGVTLTAPPNGAVFQEPAAIDLAAEAADLDGSVASVRFFHDETVLIGEDTSAPFGFAWTNVPGGSYSVTAVATDNDGGTAVSTPVQVEVLGNTNHCPSVMLTSPADQSGWLEPAEVALSATASDEDGTVSKVEFYAGTIKVAESAGPAFVASWTNAPAGDYAITAKAIDDLGGETVSSASSITVYPLPAPPPCPTRLGFWRFETTNWLGEMGQAPKSHTNIDNIPLTDGNHVLQVDRPNSANLTYRDVENNHNPNIDVQNGSVVFWFKPNWTSAGAGGAGPGARGQLLSIGQWTADASCGCWNLSISTDGNQILFVTQTNGFGMTNLVAPVSLDSNTWRRFALTCSPTETRFYVDALPAGTNGLGMTCYPNALARAVNGLSIGSDRNGNQQAHGRFDDLEIFNYVLSAGEIADRPDTDGDELPDGWELRFGLDPCRAVGNDGSDGDPDGDGLVNIEELALGASPVANDLPGGRSGAIRVHTPLE